MVPALDAGSSDGGGHGESCLEGLGQGPQLPSPPLGSWGGQMQRAGRAGG